jgi:hypothetical protein
MHKSKAHTNDRSSVISATDDSASKSIGPPLTGFRSKFPKSLVGEGGRHPPACPPCSPTGEPRNSLHYFQFASVVPEVSNRCQFRDLLLELFEFRLKFVVGPILESETLCRGGDVLVCSKSLGPPRNC